MSFIYEDYKKSADALYELSGGAEPEILLILGSGLGFMADEIESPVYVGYGDVPDMKRSTAPDHKGRFVFGRLCGKNVAVMQGRLHCYEGYSMEEAAYPVRVLRLLGTKKLLLTNAAGCVNTSWQKGDIMVINDHIRLFGFGPLNGPNISEFGPRFNDMVRAYDREYIDLAKKAAGDLGISIRTGVYMYFPGPSFETPAEIRAARVLGADAVGMSTVPEATVAAHCGMRTLGLSLLTNMAAGISGEKLSGEEVNQTAEESSERFSALVRKVIAGM